jgi:hypothetical protein
MMQLAEYTASPETVVPNIAVTVFLAKYASVNVIILVESSYLIRPSKLISPDITPGMYSANPDESFDVASGVSADKLKEHEVVCPMIPPLYFNTKIDPLKIPVVAI